MKGFFLYVIGEPGGNAPCKIGVTRTPFGRLRGLQTGYPRKLTICELWDFDNPDSMHFAEDLARASCKAHRLEGEWFNISAHDAIDRITTWMYLAAIKSAEGKGDVEPALPPPPQGVGMLANGRVPILVADL